jgi:uncharacterized membrane protein YheB (UPF0754 family)
MSLPLAYLAPPLVGSFIGYMTNYVAIKMLFRPLKPWHILGIRVPMTPGVIPSKRHDLAINMGEMVGDHLLTSKDIGKAIQNESFQNNLTEIIDTRMGELLQKDLGSITEVIPNRFHSYLLASIKVLRWRFIDQLHGYLDSDEFHETIHETIQIKIDEFLNQPLKQTFPQENIDHFYTYLDQTITDLLASPKLAQWLEELLNQKIDSFIEEDKAPSDLLPDDVIDFICTKLQDEAPTILNNLSNVVQEPELQENISEAICAAIGNFTASLGPLAGMVSGFLSPDLIKDKVKGFLTEKGDEIGEWLANETIQTKVADILTEKTREFLDTPFSSLLSTVSDDKKATLKSELVERIVTLLQHPQTAASLTDIAGELVSKQTDRPIKDILTDTLGDQSISTSTQWLTSNIINNLRSPKIKQLLDHLIVEKIEKKLLNHPIGPLKDMLPSDVQVSINEYTRTKISDLLVREVPNLVDCLDIKSLVTKKVDSLDLMRLENLLMSIMKEQFKYINMFGALLGFLIGLLNLLFLRM